MLLFNKGTKIFRFGRTAYIYLQVNGNVRATQRGNET